MASNQIEIIKSRIQRIEARYNPEEDIIPGAPAVTYTDYELLNMIRFLLIMVDSQQAQIDSIAGALKIL